MAIDIDRLRPTPSPAVIETAVLDYLRRAGGWCGYLQMVYRVAKKIRPKTFYVDGTQRAVLMCCRDLCKARVIIRRKGRIGQRSCCRRTDRKLPDEARLNAEYMDVPMVSSAPRDISTLHEPTLVDSHSSHACVMAKV